MNCGDENLKAVILAGGRGTRLSEETKMINLHKKDLESLGPYKN